MSKISGAIDVSGLDRKFGTSSELPFLLDDVGCNGSESNLLDCLPHHNCGSSGDENAGVQCLRKGESVCHIESSPLSQQCIIIIFRSQTRTSHQ